MGQTDTSMLGWVWGLKLVLIKHIRYQADNYSSD
jgi:hypothetical protein